MLVLWSLTEDYSLDLVEVDFELLGRWSFRRVLLLVLGSLVLVLLAFDSDGLISALILFLLIQRLIFVEFEKLLNGWILMDR